MKEFIQACRLPEFRKKAAAYGSIVERGLTWADEETIVYWFDVEKTTLSLAYNITTGEYI